jgi:hypothetical protein
MNEKEIKDIRNIFANFGFEHTPNQIKEDFGKELNSLKEQFEKIKPIIDEIMKSNSDIENIEEFAEKLGQKFGKKCTLDQCKHLLLMNSFFK